MREHIRNLTLFPEAQVVTLADPVATSIQASMATLSHAAIEAKVNPTVETILAGDRLDAVLIVSPNFTHRAVLEPLMNTDIAILCEKPTCTTVADARRPAKAAIFST